MIKSSLEYKKRCIFVKRNSISLNYSSYQRTMDATPKFLTLAVVQPTSEYIMNSDGALAVIIRNWLPNARLLHDKLVTGIPWICAQMNMYGKTIDIPRAMFFLGDETVKTYEYSRLSFPVQSWTHTTNSLYTDIECIRTRIKNDNTLMQLTGVPLPFDSCLLNYYRSGADSIAAHSDKEALGPANAVVTISLGASRSFVFKNKIKGDNGRYSTIKTLLHNGDLVLMAGRCQELWTHSIPREECDESRISLTYRLIGYH